MNFFYVYNLSGLKTIDLYQLLKFALKKILNVANQNKNQNQKIENENGIYNGTKATII
jgi:hypothetical protein